MGKAFKRRNCVNFYVREDWKPYWIAFLKEIEKDKEMVKLRYKNQSGLMSLALMQLVYNYLVERNVEVNLEKRR